MLALIFASGTCVALVILRILTSRNINYAFLIWNLFLAWLPLILALLVRERCANGEQRGWKTSSLVVLWLLLFPNAPYILTDLVHLTTQFYPHFWVDMVLILLCAVTGLFLGFVSLYVMQSVMANKFGAAKSWLFVSCVSGLSGVGVYIGRFLRLNSWDMFLRPATFYHRMDNWMTESVLHLTTYTFSALFGIFLFVVYLMFYALTRLPKEFQMKPAEIE